MANGSFQALHKFVLILICSIIVFSIKESFALPAPLSAKQLYEQSDIIAKVKVLGVVKVKNKVAGTENEYNSNKYQAWLKMLQVTKGNVQNNHTIIVTWNRANKKMLGSWEVNYYPNEELITHLVWDDLEKTYKTLSWNSAKRIKSSQNKLPTKDEVSFALSNIVK